MGIVNEESVGNTDVVLWYNSSIHHHASDEDRPSSANSPGQTEYVYGIVLAKWAGFDLVPHNFFNFNPMGGPRRCFP